jgi:hypothetical protein
MENAVEHLGHIGPRPAEANVGPAGEESRDALFGARAARPSDRGGAARRHELGGRERRDPGPTAVIVRNDAFDELLDRAALAEEEGDETGHGDDRRRQFALEVDRAVKMVQRARDERDWSAYTLRRFSCRLYFFRHLERIFLVACVPIPSGTVPDPDPPPPPERSAMR